MHYHVFNSLPSLYKSLRWTILITKFIFLFIENTCIFIFEMVCGRPFRYSSDSSRYKALAPPGRTVRCQEQLEELVSNRPFGETCPLQPGCQLPWSQAVHNAVPSNQGGDISVLPFPFSTWRARVFF